MKRPLYNVPQRPASAPPPVDYAGLQALLSAHSCPVVLLEGIRALPAADRPALVAFGARLARDFPQALFRSGHAEGTDEAFAEGVAQVAPSRLQLVLPRDGHRRRHVPSGAFPVALSDAPNSDMQELADATVAASPDYYGLMAGRDRHAALQAKSRYLLRDTLKVLGSAKHGLDPATLACFYVNPADPMAGGTGHTLRVCRQFGIPALDQSVWMGWEEDR